MENIIKRIFCAITALFLYLVTVFGGQFVLSANAETSTNVQTAFESTEVLDDLQGSTIGGTLFDISDYPHDDNGQPQLIAFVEFCYSYSLDKQDDYALYVYVYNPQDTAFDTTTARNKIQLTYADKASYSKYYLQFVAYSKTSGYEGRFYKFKVVLTDIQKSAMFQSLEQNSRVYTVSGIELSSNYNVTEYDVGQTYIYSGYALGYGSSLATENTLSCTVYGLGLCLSLDVHSTYYRPKGTLGGYKSCTQDTLHSVYFSVPNEIIDEYGEMAAVHATWLNALTAPIFVTGNTSVYDSLLDYIGKDIGISSSDIPYGFVTDYSSSTIMGGPGVGYYGDLAYNFVRPSGAGLCAFNTNLSSLNYIFYAGEGNNSADNYILSSDEILDWFSKYTANFGGTLVNDKYSSALFEQVDSSFTDKTIFSTDEYKLTSVTTSQNWWQRIWGASSSSKSTYEMSAIQEVTLSDMDNALSVTSFCNSFYVAESDYTDLYNYVKTAKAKAETVYLFRYYQSDYYASEATEFQTSSSLFGKYSEELDTNAYVSQMWVQLDFDVIDVTFTKDNVSTVIPVISSPKDMVSDVTPPVETTPSVETPEDGGLNWWQVLLSFLAVIFLFVILAPVLPYIIQAAIWIILLPFKAIGALLKAIGNAASNRKRGK